MRIAKVTAINWGGYASTDFHPGERTLLVGETAAGKTTFQDAIVAVVSGGDQRLGPFNTAQTEKETSGGAGGRTMASYVCGSRGDGSYLRPEGSFGYLAIQFEPDSTEGGEGIPVTAILGIEARPDTLGRTGGAQQIGDMLRVVARGCRIEASDLIDEDGLPRDLAMQKRHLRSMPGTGRDIAFPSTAVEYRSNLFGALSGVGSMPADQATKAVRGFVKAIAYKAVSNVDAMIRENVLEPPAADRELSVRRLMAGMKDVVGLRKEATRLKGNLDVLDAAVARLSTARSSIEMAYALRMAGRVREERRRLDRIDALRKQIDDLSGEDGDIQADIRKAEDRNADLDRRIADVDAELRGHAGYGRKAALEGMIAAARPGIEGAEADLARSMRSFVDASDVARKTLSLLERHAVLHAHLPSAKELVAAFGRVPDPRLPSSAEMDASTILSATNDARRVWKDLVHPQDETGLRGVVDDFWRSIREKAAHLKQVNESISTDLAGLKAGRVPYPPGVQDFLSHLRREVPKADPRLVCEVVDMDDAVWQAAVEGYLGYDRTAIVYDPAYEQDVLACMRHWNESRPRHQTATLPQLGIALGDWTTPPARSITSLLRTDDDVARRFLEAKYGSALLVEDAGTLRRTRRGVMPDGTSSGSYLYRNVGLQASELVFGVSGRERRREALQEELSRNEAEIEILDVRIRTIRPILDGLGTHLVDPADTLRTLDEQNARVAAWREEASLVDLGDLDGLRERRRVLGQEREMAARELKAANFRRGQIEAGIKTRNADVQTIVFELEDSHRDRDWTRKADASRSFLDAMLARTTAERAAQLREAFAEEVAEPTRTLVNTNENQDSRLNAVRKDHISTLVGSPEGYDDGQNERERIQVDPFHLPVEATLETFDWLDRTEAVLETRRTDIRDSGLPDKVDRCRESEHRFSTSFISSFCTRILAEIKGNGSAVNQVNDILEQMRFGKDSFRISSRYRREYDQYRNLFEKLVSMPSDGGMDLFSDEQKLDDEERKLYGKIREDLLDVDENRALAELTRISDYRNYRDYDFIRTTPTGSIALSEWGSGSGGEAETPIYAIRTAAIASAYGLFSGVKGPRPRFVMLDEAFLHMDETRTSKMLEFLGTAMGLQVIVGASTKTTQTIAGLFDRRFGFARVANDYTNVVHYDVDRVNFSRKRAEERKAIAAYAETIVPARTGE